MNRVGRKKGVPAPKATKIQMIIRVDQVIEWLAQGLRRQEMIPLAKTHWRLGVDGLDDLIEKAKDKMIAEHEKEYKDIVPRTLKQLESLYLDCKIARDRRTAVAVLERRNRMLGLDRPERIQTTVKIVTVDGDDEV